MAKPIPHRYRGRQRSTIRSCLKHLTNLQNANSRALNNCALAAANNIVPAPAQAGLLPPNIAGVVLLCQSSLQTLLDMKGPQPTC
jgi:hypothetical protein